MPSLLRRFDASSNLGKSTRVQRRYEDVRSRVRRSRPVVVVNPRVAPQRRGASTWGYQGQQKEVGGEWTELISALQSRLGVSRCVLCFAYTFSKLMFVAKHDWEKEPVFVRSANGHRVGGVNCVQKDRCLSRPSSTHPKSIKYLLNQSLWIQRP